MKKLLPADILYVAMGPVISKRTIREHGGRLQVECKQVAWTPFHIDLPAPAVEADAPAAERKRS